MGCTQSAAPVQKMKFGRSPTGHSFGKHRSLNPEDFVFRGKGRGGGGGSNRGNNNDQREGGGGGSNRDGDGGGGGGGGGGGSNRGNNNDQGEGGGGGSNREVLVKGPREIAGQQFVVEECEGVDVFLLDHMAALTIDYCKDCHIVTGPVASSVFIRNCQDCVVVVACQQLRLRDCKNLTIFLHSTTGPIIESSSGISLGCYNYSYFGLEAHLASADMSIWENEWYSVYDFTPGGGGSSNHSILPSGDPSTLILNVVPASSTFVEEGLCATSMDDRVTPLLYGPLPASQESVLFVMTPEHAQACRTVLNTFLHHPAESDTNEGNKTVGDVNNDDKLVVLRTTKRMTSPAQLSTLVGGEKRLKAFVRAAKIEEVYAGVALIAVELSFAKSKNKVKGRALVDQLRSEICRVTESETADDKSKFLCWTGKEADEKALMIFEQWRVNT